MDVRRHRLRYKLIHLFSNTTHRSWEYRVGLGLELDILETGAIVPIANLEKTSVTVPVISLSLSPSLYLALSLSLPLSPSLSISYSDQVICVTGYRTCATDNVDRPPNECGCDVIQMDGSALYIFLMDIGVLCLKYSDIKIFRIFKLSKHFRGLIALGLALKHSVSEILVLFVFLFVAVLFFATIGYFADENNEESDFTSVIGAFWWAMVTITSVGYGDEVPKSVIGKLNGALCAITVLTRNWSDRTDRKFREDFSDRPRDISLSISLSLSRPLFISPSLSLSLYLLLGSGDLCNRVDRPPNECGCDVIQMDGSALYIGSMLRSGLFGKRLISPNLPEHLWSMTAKAGTVDVCTKTSGSLARCVRMGST
eukprot:sb/3465858/